MSKNKVIIVMPAYNAEKTLLQTYKDIPLTYRKNVILVDDASNDKTCAISDKLKIKTVRHLKNKGYGGNQKTCYKKALGDKADIVVMLHPDYQYDARMIDSLVKPIELGICDMVMGNRIRKRKEVLEGGMPIYKYLSNRILTIIENIILGLNLGEYHSGLRAYTKKVLNTIPYNNFSNDFVFDQEFIISATFSNFRIGEVPVPVRYFAEASSINFMRSVKYGLGTLLNLVKYILQKLNLAEYRIFKK